MSRIKNKLKGKIKGKIKARFVFFLASHGYIDEDDEEAWFLGQKVLGYFF
jgi:hypothetical protein